MAYGYFSSCMVGQHYCDAVEGVAEGCHVATILPGRRPGRWAPDDCLRASEVHFLSKISSLKEINTVGPQC